jgi:hypothetical protein
MEQREIKEKIDKGWIQSRVIIEIVGKPKEHVEKAIQDLMDHMRKNKDVIILTEHIEKAKEHEGDLWSTFSDVEFLVEGIPKLVGFCFDYMPSSVEIMEPEDFRLKAREIASFVNEMQAKLHNLGIVIKRLKNENLFLKQNSSALVLNYLTVLLVNKKRTIEDLEKLTSIKKEELKPFLDKLVKEGKIKEEDGTYTFAK